MKRRTAYSVKRRKPVYAKKEIKNAKAKVRRVMKKAFLMPSSLLMAVIVAAHGIYRSEKTVNENAPAADRTVGKPSGIRI